MIGLMMGDRWGFDSCRYCGKGGWEESDWMVVAVVVAAVLVTVVVAVLVLVLVLVALDGKGI